MIQKIADNTYRISEFGGTNCYLLVGKERALLIDVGTGFFDILSEVKSITEKPLDVVCTHNHTDHLGGYGAFPSIYIHRDDAKCIKKIMLSRFARKVFLLGSKNILSEKIPLKNVKKSKNKLSLIPIEEGHIFDLGDRKIEVLSSKGHTVGSIILLDKEAKLLFAGDNICPSPWLFLPYSTSVEEWLVEAKKILALSYQYTIWWGHEGGLLDTQIIKRVCDIGDEILLKYPKNKRFSTIKAYPSNDRINGSVVFRTGNVYKK